MEHRNFLRRVGCRVAALWVFFVIGCGCGQAVAEDHPSAFDRGLALQKEGRLDEALEAFREAVTSKPGDAIAHAMLGNVLYLQGKFGEAVAPYRRVVELAPRNVMALRNLGGALTKAGKPEEAAEVIRLAAKIEKEREMTKHRALADLVAAKRGAALLFSGRQRPVGINGYGVFVSPDGLALVDLGSLSFPVEPQVTDAEGKRLDLGVILGMLPEQEMALMKFDHRPKVWLKVAAEQPEVGESIALVILDPNDLGKQGVPPIIGPIIAKRSAMTTNLLVPRFTRFLSIGVDIAPEQATSLGASMFVIDRDGDLVGFTAGLNASSTQTFVGVVSAAGLGGKIREFTEVGRTIPFPLPEANKMVDPAVLHPDFRRFDIAIRRRQLEEARKIINRILEHSPTSPVIRSMAASRSTKLHPLIGLDEIPEPDPDDPVALQVQTRLSRVDILATNEDLEGAIRELEAILEVCPADYYHDRLRLARIYDHLGRLDEAERYFREAYSAAPDSIYLCEAFASLLIRQGKIEEGKKVTAWVARLREIYGW